MKVNSCYVKCWWEFADTNVSEPGWYLFRLFIVVSVLSQGSEQSCKGYQCLPLSSFFVFECGTVPTMRYMVFFSSFYYPIDSCTSIAIMIYRGVQCPVLNLSHLIVTANSSISSNIINYIYVVISFVTGISLNPNA